MYVCLCVFLSLMCFCISISTQGKTKMGSVFFLFIFECLLLYCQHQNDVMHFTFHLCCWENVSCVEEGVSSLFR